MKRNNFMIMAAMIVGLTSFAHSADDKGAQLYEIKISVKTTVAKVGKVSAKSNPFVDDTETVTYRVSGSRQWKGVVWGCDCEAVQGDWRVINEIGRTVSGCVIWDTKAPNSILFIDDINWRLLNAIDAKGDKCEAAWTIGSSCDDSGAFLGLSGFGQLGLSKNPSGDCFSYIKNISGNVAGWMPAPAYETKGSPVVCTFCGVVNEGNPDVTETALAWDFCPCTEVGDPDYTAVSGTWSMKYNAQLSKKLSTNASILDTYKFPATVKIAVAKKVAGVLGENN